MTDHDLDLWHRELAGVITSTGSPYFFESLIGAIKRFIRLDFPQVWLFHFDGEPDLLYHEFHHESEVGLHVDEYIDGKYKIDPFYQASSDKVDQGIYTIRSLRSYDYDQYSLAYYSRLHVSDEISHIVSISPTKAINISLMRSNPSPEFGSVDLAFLKSAEPVIRALIKQHWQKQAAVGERDFSIEVEQIIQHATRNFGRTLLTEREREVVELSLMGYSIKTAAAKLDISTETLKRHRKHIYSKLDITSNTELHSAFIRSLPLYARIEGGKN